MSAAVLHLSRCADCMEVYQNMYPEIIDMKYGLGFAPESGDIEEPFHLEYADYIEPYVLDRISDVDREIVDTHIMACSDCAGMIRDLQEFQERLSARQLPESSANPGLFQRLYAAATHRRVALAFTLIVFIGIGSTSWYFYSKYEQTASISTDVTPSIDPNRNIANLNLSDPGETTEILKQELPPAPAIIPLQIPKFIGSLRLDPPGELRGDSGMIPIIVTSANGVAVRGQPRLSWRPVQEVDKYDISIFDTDDTLVGGKQAIIGNAWTTRGLRKGKSYKWQVTAKTRESEADQKNYIGQGVFHVISSADEMRIDRARGPIEKGRALAEAGLTKEAAIEFRRIPSSDIRFEAARAYLRQLGF